MLINRVAKFLYVALLLVSVQLFADLPDFSRYAETLSPSVVNISTTRASKGGHAGPELDEYNEIIQRFLGPQFRIPQENLTRTSSPLLGFWVYHF